MAHSIHSRAVYLRTSFAPVNADKWRQIDPDSNIWIGEPESVEEFEKYYALRWAVLRAPWRQPMGSERDEYENDAIHVMICDETGQTLAVGRAHFLDETTAQIRYMAVNDRIRDRGLGSRVLQELENKIAAAGRQKIILNARENALAFYERNRYKNEGPAPTLYNALKHFRMTKKL